MMSTISGFAACRPPSVESVGPRPPLGRAYGVAARYLTAMMSNLPRFAACRTVSPSPIASAAAAYADGGPFRPMAQDI
jgi:hypothetical protein